jgi:flagellar hook-associated protein 3 FlgL
MISATGNRLTAEIRRQSGLAEAIAREQISVSTGKRIQRASDDPVAAARVLRIVQNQSNSAAWVSNLEAGRSLAAQADQVASGLSRQLSRARELVVAGASDSASIADRATMAAELATIADEIDSLAATRAANGDPLFSANPISIRFGSDDIFAPVPARAAMFAAGSTPLSQIVRDAGANIGSGNRAQIDPSLTAIDGAISSAADSAADIGLRAERIDRLLESERARNLAGAEEQSTLEDTNLSEALTRLNALSVTLEAAQAAFARINRRNLFDILG